MQKRVLGENDIEGGVGERQRPRRRLDEADAIIEAVPYRSLPCRFDYRLFDIETDGASRAVPCHQMQRDAAGAAADIQDRLALEQQAFDDWKAGRWSADPFLDMMIPTTLDPTMAPPGKHFMSCFVQYAPPKIDGRDWTDADRDGFAESVISQIAQYSPGFRDRIVHMVRTPREIEAEVGLTEGNIFQGELTFDQLTRMGYAQ